MFGEFHDGDMARIPSSNAILSGLMALMFMVM
jgi:hypothetical protein